MHTIMTSTKNKDLDQKIKKAASIIEEYYKYFSYHTNNFELFSATIFNTETFSILKNNEMNNLKLKISEKVLVDFLQIKKFIGLSKEEEFFLDELYMELRRQRANKITYI